MSKSAARGARKHDTREYDLGAGIQICLDLRGTLSDIAVRSRRSLEAVCDRAVVTNDPDAVVERAAVYSGYFERAYCVTDVAYDLQMSVGEADEIAGELFPLVRACASSADGPT
ncbi:MAG: hypothetical protein R3F55_13845 [Alphaproteobacteria bacterium]